MKKNAQKPAFRNPANIAVSTTVRCGGQTHRIVLTKSGRMVLVDHPDLKAERAMVALGGEKCRCLEILDEWARHDPGNRFPNVIKEALAASNSIRERRAKNVVIDELVEFPLIKRQRRAIARIALREWINFAARRLPMACGATSRLLVEIKVGGPGIIPDISVFPSNGMIYITLPVTWFSRVYRRGLAVVDGHFVLDVLSEDEHGVRVMAAKRAKPMREWIKSAFQAFPAWVVNDAGRKKLIWEARTNSSSL